MSAPPHSTDPPPTGPQDQDRDQDSGAALIVIGASVGAVQALSTILPALPDAFPLPIVIVVHIPPTKQSFLAEIFAPRCRMTVKEAEDKEPLTPGTVYFAPPNYHLLIEPDLRLSLSSEDPVFYSRPSIDLLFESAVDACGTSLIGVILTGANADGARGIRALCQAGGTAIIQTPDTAEGTAMPLAAMKACPRARVLPLQDIAAALTAASTHPLP